LSFSKIGLKLNNNNTLACFDAFLKLTKNSRSITFFLVRFWMLILWF